MYRFCFYPHPSSANHGCEAIAVSSYNILKKYMPSSACTLMVKYPKGSDRRGSELAYSLFDEELTFAMPALQRFSAGWIKNILYRAAGHDKSIELLCKKTKKELASLIETNDVFVSIGGDNYCYGRPGAFYAMNRVIHEGGKKSMLWGCSVEPSAITAEMVSDLKNYNTIVTRESLSFEALLKKGLKNVKLYPDPAFTLKPVFCEKIRDNTVGINISPMILNYAGQKREIAFNAYRRLIVYIIDKTDFNIAFIPHVTACTTDDRAVLKRLYDETGANSRITVYGDMDCQRLKCLISRCRFFIGARTHATIAAYSSCVPTLVCGYSVKAKGISTDLFGTYKNYVVPVQDIDNEEALSEAFRWLADNEEPIRRTLIEIMPDYIRKAWQAGEEFANVTK